MVTTKVLVFQARLEKLKGALTWVRCQVEDIGFSHSDVRKIELALEEALVNIILYAYKNSKGIVEISFSHSPSRIEFIIKDKGPSFNPLKHSLNIDLDAPLEERKEGGLGIAMIRQNMDEVRYERVGSYNLLTLAKTISSSR